MLGFKACRAGEEIKFFCWDEFLRKQIESSYVLREVVMLQKGSWIDPKSFSRLTILFQSVGSMVLAWEALSKLTPVFFKDMRGYAFMYVIARVAGSFVAFYTHYPTINTDMLARVCSQSSSYNNNTKISSSFWQLAAKVWYNRLQSP
ncbi:hypothetical protein KC19_VG011300 [Ceratodon purpureus]|uniref:ALG11 mannosyltransferase N-terminal domain-containing protein n=1 Tax=Ceratodon purpureus TaxID=3225 RepID=A0A8T0HL47_CERPU|nr:hypothetical protein KC19_VG011300 [Ceratodon purpureus]